MSTPDPNPKPSPGSVTVPRPITTTTPITQTLKTPSSQPQASYPSYRVTAPFQRHHPQPNPYLQPYPIRRTHQDPSGRGFPTRPGRAHPVVVDPVGYPPRPVYAFNNQGQFGSGLDPMVQFIKAHPHIQQAAQLGSTAGPMKGVPHFLQPRVAHPTTTSILESNVHKTARKRDDVLVLVRKRKVRLTEGASLYSLCRSWLRNGAHEGIQRHQNYTMTSLPKPLPVEITETSLPKDSLEEPNHEEDKEDEEAVKELSESDLLKRHVDRAKKVRARLREERLKKIARYKARLALLLPPFGEQCKNE